MLSTALTPHLFPLHKTGKFFHHRHRHHRHEVYPFRADVVRSSSSLQETKKPPPVSSDERRELLTSWESIALPPVKAAKRVVLVRHGQSTWNAEGRIQGSSDFSVLTLKGESQAETSRQMLLDDSFDVCFSSPLIRSKRTAEIIWGSRTEEIITESNLREIDLYSFQGLLKNEGKAKYGAAYRQWQIDAPNFNIDGHYPVRELWERARSCWTKILTHESRSILVVAHNAVNQALVATAMGLGTEYFRILLQSNCGVSVLDFTPKPEGGTPDICLNRLNQTPSSPVAAGSSGGRKASMRIILVSHGTSQNDGESGIPLSGDSPMNMLGVIQDSTRFQPLQSGWLRGYKDEITRALWDQSGVAWKSLLDELSKGSDPQNVVVAVAHPALHIAMMGHCLNLTKEWLGSFHLDAGSISVVDFPDSPSGRGVIRCINYTAHLGRWSIPITRSTLDDEDF
ncbi:UNVERIFIED_CONTAM: 2-carboxy-D-arabinitol-1-phosphatase [Sesamum radiatum]|uniref:2-carboxy-D-arabinitol-1-phosphatase n=1 Tax=Sesamum radiatum TaxID=300843 RepID=A0AAW2W302_SESRA